MSTSINKEPFGAINDKPVELYILATKAVTAKIINYGARVVSLLTPDRKGNMADVVLGYDTLPEYQNDRFFLGAIIGRYANRIANARFKLSGREYHLTANNGPNALHGGPTGFHTRLWSARQTSNGVELAYRSVDGEEGYPGNLDLIVTYSLEGSSLKIVYAARTDQATVVNVTHHSYFNLAGHDSGDVLGHELHIDAESFTPTDLSQIPTGELRNVAGTPLDFRQPTVIGARINSPDEQLRIARGYDHNWVLRPGGEPTEAAYVREPKTGRRVTVLTTEPGLQFYSGNHLDGTRGKTQTSYHKHAGLCLETQHFPNSPNTARFPSTVLRPGQHFSSVTVYRFSAE